MGLGTLPLLAGLEVFLPCTCLVSFLSKPAREGSGFSHNALFLTLVGTKPKTFFFPPKENGLFGKRKRNRMKECVHTHQPPMWEKEAQGSFWKKVMLSI